jgi:hypothetical protein
MLFAPSHRDGFTTRLGSILLLLCLLCLLWPVTKEVSAAATPSQLLIILVDALDPIEIANDPVWRTLAEKGAYGLMNTRTGGRSTPAATHLSLGTGARADAPSDAIQTYAFIEMVRSLPAGELYHSIYGSTPPESSLLCLDIARLKRTNQARPDIKVGWLGEQLKTLGVSVAYVGNADTAIEHSRPGVLFIMDAAGVVPQGVAGEELLLLDPEFPYQMRTNYQAVLTAIEAQQHQQALVVELADLARLDSYREHLEEEVWLQQRRTTLTQIGLFIHHLMALPHLANRTLLIISPTPRVDRIAAGHWLAPLLLIQPHLTGPVLYSQGTRRPGITLNTEIAGAIVELAQTGTTTILRQAVLAGNDTTTWVAQTYNKLIALQRMRAPLLQSYVLLCVVVFLAAVPVLWGISLGNLYLAVIWEYALLIVAAFPLAALLLGLFPISSVGWALVSVGLLTALLASASKALGRCKLDSFLFLFSAISLGLLLDLITGARLIQWSSLGYDVIGGARFYGIGNEFGGILLTAVLMAVGILLHRHPAPSYVWRAIPVFFLTTCIAGAPWWGANNGVAASAILGFTLTTYFLLQVPLSRSRALLAALLLILFAAAAITIDLTWNKTNPSHLGQLARQVMARGVAPIWVMAIRKLAMNWKLLRYTIWTRVLLSSLAVSSVLIFRPIPWVRDCLALSPPLRAAAKGALVTAMFLLVLNDSGVVAAATAMIPVTTLLLFLAARSLAMKRVTAK